MMGFSGIIGFTGLVSDVWRIARVNPLREKDGKAVNDPTRKPPSVNVNSSNPNRYFFRVVPEFPAMFHLMIVSPQGRRGVGPSAAVADGDTVAMLASPPIDAAAVPLT